MATAELAGQSADIELSVSDFVALHNQLLEYSLPSVVIVGELSSFRVSKNRWVYFDLKDELASVKFFATVYQLSGPLEDGMLLRVRGTPRVHPQFGFSINVTSLQPVGEGTIRRASDMLQRQLAAEGLFDPARKRALPYPPQSVGIVTSQESAAYADFIKVLAARWGGLDLQLADVQVQGEPAPVQIASAIAAFNQLPKPPEVLVLIRGGGSAEDLWAFSSEPVVRAVAGSRVPTMVAIGHEVDISLAELAADVRASTPSNAAELLVPDRVSQLAQLRADQRDLGRLLGQTVQQQAAALSHSGQQLDFAIQRNIERAKTDLRSRRQIIELLSPRAILRRGYAIIRGQTGAVLRSAAEARRAGHLAVEFGDGTIKADVKDGK